MHVYAINLVHTNIDKEDFIRYTYNTTMFLTDDFL